jgi:hypothetical protein
MVLQRRMRVVCRRSWSAAALPFRIHGSAQQTRYAGLRGRHSVRHECCRGSLAGPKRAALDGFAAEPAAGSTGRVRPSPPPPGERRRLVLRASAVAAARGPSSQAVDGAGPAAPWPAAGAADQMHARFADLTSDFLAYLNLWRYLRERQKALSSNQFRKMCRAEYLHYLRVREWQDLEAQLRQAARAVGVAAGALPAEPDSVRVHSALLAGLLSHVGVYDPEKRDYIGARNAHFAISPGSVLFSRGSRSGRSPAASGSPRFVMAANWSRRRGSGHESSRGSARVDRTARRAPG